MWDRETVAGETNRTKAEADAKYKGAVSREGVQER